MHDDGAAVLEPLLQALYSDPAVTVVDCVGPATCTWSVSFPNKGPVDTILVGDLSMLAGNGADIAVTVQTVGVMATDILNAPLTLTVLPAPADPAMTIAYGSGLYSATAGTAATFTVQPKDQAGNNR